MEKYKDELELVVHLRSDLGFLASKECDRLLLHAYIEQAIRQAFEMVGNECKITGITLRIETQTLARGNENGDWVLR